MTAIATEETAAPRRAPGPSAAFAAFALILILCFLPTVATTIGTWANSGSYHHGFLVAPLVFWLIWREERAASPHSRRERGKGEGDGLLESERPHPALRTTLSPRERGKEIVALAAVAFFAALWLAGRAVAANIVEQFALVSLLIAGAVLAFGAPWARARAFPLALLYFMVPFGTSLAPPLQNLAAGVATALLNAAQIDTARDGLILSTATGRFEIAEGCAGLNFLLASVIIGAVYGALAMRGWKKRLVLVGALAALSVVANLLRIFLVIAITAGSGGRIELAADHLLFGWALYGVMLCGFMLVARRFADDRPSPARVAPTAVRWRTLALAFAMVFAAASVERLTTPQIQTHLKISHLTTNSLPPLAAGFGNRRESGAV